MRFASCLAVCSALLLGCESQGAEPSAVGSAQRGASAAIVGRTPLRVAYSDSPGWTAFEIGIELGWFRKAGVDVDFSWSDYGSSLDAFSSGKVDAVAVTHADALALGAGGAKSKMILLTDFSNGNDEVVARPGIETFKDLRGKKVGLELTLIEHLLFLKACEKNGMKATDVDLVNFPTGQTASALAGGEVAAVVAWYPVSAQALRFAPGAKPVFTSADVPGLIYDAVAVSPASLADRRDDWIKFARVWYRISDFVRDSKTRDRALAIMGAKVGMKAEEYGAVVLGTHFLSLEEAKMRYIQGRGLDSLYGSTSVADEFNVSHKVYKDPQSASDYIDPAVLTAL
jgi:NitT/TauT family transport system substrate-binding protein